MLGHSLRRFFSHKLMISNISTGATTAELESWLKSLGVTYKSLLMPEEPNTKTSKGYAVLEFALDTECLAVKERLANEAFMRKTLRVIHMKGTDDQQKMIRPLLAHRNPDE